MRELDFSYGSRRGRPFQSQHLSSAAERVGAALRAIPDQNTEFEGAWPLSVDAARTHSQRNSGLMLVTGPTGSGKSTTIACNDPRDQ